MKKILINTEIDGDLLENITAELTATNGEEFELIINSDGGDVFAGLKIFNELQKYRKFKIIVDNKAFSIASIIALATPNRYIADNSFVMTHDVATVTFGGKAAHETSIEMLDVCKKTIQKIYNENYNGDSSMLMERENWFTTEQSVQFFNFKKINYNNQKNDNGNPAVENIFQTKKLLIL